MRANDAIPANKNARARHLWKAMPRAKTRIVRCDPDKPLLPENVRVVVLRLFTHLALKLFPLWKTLDANSAHWEHLSLGFDVA